jgi:DNA integrity scanning protein DisA with diadenylate cyclase activity
MDGAIILDKYGTERAYGARIESSINYKNHETKHATALGASKDKGNICILVSEEDKKIRIFKARKMSMQLDPKEKNIESSISSATDILETIGVGTIGTI